MLRQRSEPAHRPVRRRALQVLVLTGTALALSGCDGSVWLRGGWPKPITLQGKRILVLYQGSLIAALCVGALVLGLIIWCCIRFRQRGDELPRQVRYNLPIEVIYTVIPVVIISILFYFTAIDENYEDKLTAHPDVVVHVVGFQWSWQFDYQGQNLQITGRPGVIPTLVIPVDKTIRFILTSPDVVHSFWVIPFLFKRDVIPGRINQFEVTVTTVGSWQGKCTEFCGVDHDRMLFAVQTVTYPQYLAFLQRARTLALHGSDIYSTNEGQPITYGSST